ncbi:hypothetical protein O6H91_08G117600 [Diphasiastrum complanatum]|uniref:Uncharacterized protein n=1 Tax=Diphasiastrum complanatum TaxID=34168 RepID=A0ACC2D1T8_DIPCM|nr:hypothetical protein O6H91_08G117600 [Diphasiastrum complanatum]
MWVNSLCRTILEPRPVPWHRFFRCAHTPCGVSSSCTNDPTRLLRDRQIIEYACLDLSLNISRRSMSSVGSCSKPGLAPSRESSCAMTSHHNCSHPSAPRFLGRRQSALFSAPSSVYLLSLFALFNRCYFARVSTLLVRFVQSLLVCKCFSVYDLQCVGP